MQKKEEHRKAQKQGRKGLGKLENITLNGLSNFCDEACESGRKSGEVGAGGK